MEIKCSERKVAVPPGQPALDTWGVVVCTQHTCLLHSVLPAIFPLGGWQSLGRAEFPACTGAERLVPSMHRGGKAGSQLDLAEESGNKELGGPRGT